MNAACHPEERTGFTHTDEEEAPWGWGLVQQGDTEPARPQAVPGGGAGREGGAHQGQGVLLRAHGTWFFDDREMFKTAQGLLLS